MRRIFLASCLLLPLSLSAQTSENEDRGFLEGLLEDNLSGAGRDVQIEGFRGALSSTASIDSLTIADDDGVWLTLKDVTLDWNRAALLSGELNVTELSAKQLLMPRKPAPSPSLPSAEATPLQIPELPVSVRIAKFSVPNVMLGEDILGQAAQLNVTGSARLAGGSASVDLSVLRGGGKSGQITLSAGFLQETQNISLDLSLVEPQGGLAATLLNIPDAPAISLNVAGTGPVSDFQADIALRSAEQTRLTGQVTLGTDPESPASTRLNARLGGNMAPLLAPEYRAFFGAEPKLYFQGTRNADGALALDQFQLTTEALTAKGQARIGADGTLSHLSLRADLKATDGQPVLLPLSGPRNYVQAAQLSAAYDVDAGDRWAVTTDVTGLRRDDLSLGTATFEATGTYLGTSIAGNLRADLNDLSLEDPALAQAVGSQILATMAVDWTKGAPVSMTDIALQGDHFQASGDARVSRIPGSAELDIWLDLAAQTKTLRPYADLAGRDLDGAAQLRATGTIYPVSGGLDLQIDGTTRDLRVDIPRLDPFLLGRSTVEMHAERNESGAKLTTALINDFGRMDSLLSLGGQNGSGFVKLNVADLAPGLPELPGAAKINVFAKQDGQAWDMSADLTLPGENHAALKATLDTSDTQEAAIDGTATLTLRQLARFSDLAGQRLGGQLTGQIEGNAQLSDQSFGVSADIKASGLKTGIAVVDDLLRGPVTASAQASRDGTGVVKLQGAEMRTNQGDLAISSIGPDTLSLSATLRNLSVLTPELSGAANLSGTAALKQENWHLDITGHGPGGANLAAKGWVAGDGSDTSLALSGTSPMALANGFIRPMNLSGMARYDLRLAGPPSLQSTSGQITARNARLALPDQRLALEDIAADITLEAGTARVSVTSRAVSGGTISLNGPVGLSGPYNADLALQLDQVVLTDPTLYETTVSGPLTITGGLTGGARIAGQVQLGTTELRVPNPSGSDQADLPGLRHVGEPAAVNRTRSFAGLIQTDTAETSAGGVFALDLKVLAPDRIFVRGRGLDAELGGALSLKGDTNNVLPEGRFDLIRGRLDILGKRFSLTEGLVQLQGAFDPFIRFAASTDAGNTTATIVIEGQASAPELSFTSSPSLPQDEVLALILFGKDLSTISPLQAVRLAAAVRTLAGKGGDGIAGQVRRGLALDDLDVTTSDTGATEARVGKYLSENIYSEVTADTAGNSQINLNLNINRSVTARGRLASDGETGIGIFIENDY
ncbi:MAG: translocation/assembly module TamB domain-containing protein [Thalassovita sp.]